MFLNPLFFLLLITLHIQINSNSLKHSIKQVYNKMLQEPLPYEMKANETSISSEAIIVHSPQCEAIEEETATKIVYKNCTVFSIFNMTVTVAPNYTFFMNDFYIEYFYPEMAYQLNSKVVIPTIHTQTPPGMDKTYSFNNAKAPLSSSYFRNLTNLMHSTAEALSERYKSTLISRFTTETENNILETELSSAFILLYLDSIVTETEDPTVTYYSFLLPQTDKVINLNEMTVIGEMTVQFEYSINYNLTYQEGSLTLLNFDFEKDISNKEDIFKHCLFHHFQPENEDSKVKEFIYERFKDWLMRSITKFYSLKNEKPNSPKWIKANSE